MVGVECRKVSSQPAVYPFAGVTLWPICCRWSRRVKLPEEVAAKLGAVVSATVSIYQTIRSALLPTPAKSHYTYNMRDLSKVFQVGSLACQSMKASGPFRYHCILCFSSRLHLVLHMGSG